MVSTPRREVDATVRVRLFPTALGGRRTAISIPEYRCPVFFDDQREDAYDCQLLLGEVGAILEPGGPSVIVPVTFMSPDLVLPMLRPGVRFILWEGKDIGEAVVVQMPGQIEGG